MLALPLAAVAVDSCRSDVEGGKEGGAAQLQNVFFPLPIIRYFRAAVSRLSQSPQSGMREGEREEDVIAGDPRGGGRQMIDRTVRQPLMETPPTTTTRYYTTSQHALVADSTGA